MSDAGRVQTCCGLPLGPDGRCQHRPGHTTPVVRPEGWPGDTGCPHLAVECANCGWGGTPEDLQLSWPRCCTGCPDCMGIGSREQIKGLTADVEALRERVNRYESTLMRIANDDFRGPEPWARTAARDALFPSVQADDHAHLWQALRSVPPSWRCHYCGEITEIRP